jgi:hypothetical protein
LHDRHSAKELIDKNWTFVTSISIPPNPLSRERVALINKLALEVWALLARASSAAENERKEEAGDEAADMRHVRDSALVRRLARGRYRADPTEGLQ